MGGDLFFRIYLQAQILSKIKTFSSWLHKMENGNNIIRLKEAFTVKGNEISYSPKKEIKKSLEEISDKTHLVQSFYSSIS